MRAIAVVIPDLHIVTYIIWQKKYAAVIFIFIIYFLVTYFSAEIISGFFADILYTFYDGPFI